MNRCKREIGLASFYYALIHLGSALIKAVLKRGFFPWDMFIRPYVIPGEITLLILLALALTSSYYSQRLLGWHRWKSLHKTIYVGEACVFLHLAIQGGTRLLWAVVIFLPLLFIQRFRRSQNSSTS
jgi:sulfoxide reductase heme-binding subunit YedZ